MFTEGSSPQRLNTTAVDPKCPLGSRLIDTSGRVFRYTRASAVAIVAGSLCQVTDALTSSHILGKTLSASPVGAYSKGINEIRLATTTTNFAANFFSEGIVGVKAVQPGSFAGTVSGHPAVTASTSLNFRLADPYPGPTVLTAGSIRSGIFPNPFDGVVICGTGYARPPICVPQLDVAASEYFWGLVEGHGLGIYEGTLIEGVAVTPSLVTAGSVSTISDDLTTLTTGGRNATTVVGTCLAWATGWSSAKGCFINWRL